MSAIEMVKCRNSYESNANSFFYSQDPMLRINQNGIVIDTSTDDIEGATVSLEILETGSPGHFQDQPRKRRTHELMWESYAASYDRILLELPFYQEVLHRHVTAMNNASILNVMDIGAGTGNVTVQLLQKGKTCTAIDISNAMLRKLFSKLGGKFTKNLTVIEDTAEWLPHLKDGCFDGVTALLAFFAMQDPFAALNEALRLLKSGGTLIVTEPKACFDVSELMEFAERHLHEKGLFPGLEEDWNRIQTVAPHISQKIQEVQTMAPSGSNQSSWNAEKLFGSLKNMGFTELTIEDSHLGNCATIMGVSPG